MDRPFLPYAKQSIIDQDLQAVKEALFAPRISRGEKTKEFEEKVASFTGALYAVSFMNATSALYAAMHVVDATPYDRFYVPANTFIATAASGMRLGIRPRYVDIERDSGNMSLLALKEVASHPFTRGRSIVMPVHFSGIAVDVTRLEKLFNEPDLIIIEDAAHAIGSQYPTGEKVGSCHKSHMTVFSFHPSKTMTTGEGGIVTTNSEMLYRRLMRFRNSGIERQEEYLTKGKEQPGYYEVQEITGNYHMTELQAALGLSQLERLELFVEKRRHLVGCYRKLLSGLPHIKLFSEAHDARTAYHLMVVQINFSALNTTRETVMRRLLDLGIGTEVHYIPLYRHPAAKEPSVEENYPEMEAYYSEALSLPLYYDLTEDDIERVVSSLKEVLAVG